MKNIFPLILIALFACNSNNKEEFTIGSFGYDYNFLKQTIPDLIILGDTNSRSVLVSPSLQGRVLTSTSSRVGGKPVRSNDRRRMSVLRSAAGIGRRCLSSVPKDSCSPRPQPSQWHNECPAVCEFLPVGPSSTPPSEADPNIPRPPRQVPPA